MKTTLVVVVFVFISCIAYTSATTAKLTIGDLVTGNNTIVRILGAAGFNVTLVDLTNSTAYPMSSVIANNINFLNLDANDLATHLWAFNIYRADGYYHILIKEQRQLFQTLSIRLHVHPYTTTKWGMGMLPVSFGSHFVRSTSHYVRYIDTPTLL
jgi:hypothetical protein